MNARLLLATGACACAAALAACSHSEGGSTSQAPTHDAPQLQAITAVPLGDVAGGQKTPAAATIRNPYEGNPQAVQEGRQLFVRMNCAGCHAYDATGGMGPNLTDGYWRYGGAPVQVFKSIFEGRPQGMPAWNPALPPEDIWKLVAYVQSLGGTVPAEEFQAGVQGDRPPKAGPPTPAEARPDAGEHP